MAGEARAEPRLGLALLAVALNDEPGQRACKEHQLVPVGDALEPREAAHAVAAELGLYVDVVYYLGRENAAVPQYGLTAVFDCAHARIRLSVLCCWWGPLVGPVG